MYAQLLQHLLPTFEPPPSSAITQAPTPGVNFLQVLEEEQARLQAASSGNEAEPVVKAEEAGVPHAALVEPDDAEQTAETEVMSAKTGYWPAAYLPGITESETSGSEAGTSANPPESEEHGRPLAERSEPASLRAGASLAGSIRGAAELTLPPESAGHSGKPMDLGNLPPRLPGAGTAFASLLRSPWQVRQPIAEASPATMEAPPHAVDTRVILLGEKADPQQSSEAPSREPAPKPSLLLKDIPAGVPPQPASGESQAAATGRAAGAPAPDVEPPPAAPQAAATDPSSGLQGSLHEEASSPPAPESQAQSPRNPAHGLRGMPDRTEPPGAVVGSPAGESSAPPSQAAAAVRQASDAAPKASAEPGPPQAPPEPRATLQSLGSHAVRGVRYLVSNGDRTMTLRLSPTSLGEVRLEVHANSDGLSVRIASANPAVRHVLESQMPTLREAFAREGIEVARVDVGPSLSASTGSMGSHQPAGREPGSFGQGTQQPPAYGRERHSKEPADRKPRVKPATAHLGAVDLYV